MSRLAFLVKNNYVWILLNLPAAFLMLYLIAYPKDYKAVIVPAAYSAFGLLVFTLSLNPLVSIFPKQKWLKNINKYRRVIGVSSFVYAFVHVSSYVAKRGGVIPTIPWVIHPIILPGFVAFGILLILALTSNNYSIKQLTGPRWKHLHNKVYIAQWLVFIHMFLIGSEKKFFAIAVFLPLAFIQLIRRKKKKDVRINRQRSETSPPQGFN